MTTQIRALDAAPATGPVQLTGAERGLLLSALGDRRWERARYVSPSPATQHDPCCQAQGARDAREEQVREAIRSELASIDALIAKLERLDVGGRGDQGPTDPKGADRG